VIVADPFELKIFSLQADTSDVRTIKPCFEKQNTRFFRRDLSPSLRADNVLANVGISSDQSDEGEIRRTLIEADPVDCMVALPGQLFYSTQIPVCLWFLAKNKNAYAKRGFRDRRKQTLFIDARKLGTLIDREMIPPLLRSSKTHINPISNN